MYVFIFLDTAKRADAASEWSLENADFVAYVFENVAVGDEGYMVDHLCHDMDELRHFSIGDG